MSSRVLDRVVFVQHDLFGGTVRFHCNDLKHFFTKHCEYQNASQEQYRENLIAIFGESVLESLRSLWSQNGSQQTDPFFKKLVDMLQIAYEKERYITYDQYLPQSKQKEQILLAVTDSGLVVIFVRDAKGYHFKTAYFTHHNDLEAPTLRGTIRSLVCRYANKSGKSVHRLPLRESIAKGKKGELRNNIKFANPKSFGFVHGVFNPESFR
ncbi:MAG: hypothetical protein N2112_15835 [Gemmataceae bacterium]|jgi:hypothetical protein|nr:hypothetical protein [Gemmataceae bacterium]